MSGEEKKPYVGVLSLGFPQGLKGGVQINLSGSKSQSNRFLLLRAATGADFSIDNLSDSDDTRAMQAVLCAREGTVDIGHAGTAMRFGTAFLASCPGADVLLTGSSRMKERPIAPLADALRSLGAEVEYEEEEGFPPLRIRGKRLPGGDCTIDSTVSSQFVTALMLVAPSFEKGLDLHLKGRSVSRPYIAMTASALRAVGLECVVEQDRIVVPPGKVPGVERVLVESDWSSASYFFSLCALSGRNIGLRSLLADSSQGDSRLTEIYRRFGVESVFGQEGSLLLNPVGDFVLPENLCFDLEDTPDVAQTVAVTMAGLKIKGTLSGLGTLRVKETDRIAALEAELAKFGVRCSSTRDTLSLNSFSARQENILLETYRDHRMAMAFAPLALGGAFRVNEPGVVAKSYPRFWDDMSKMGAEIGERCP